jgi:hypothetical protein
MKLQEKLMTSKEQGEKKQEGWSFPELTLLQEKGNRTQKQILETLLEFKFEYLENEGKAKKIENEENRRKTIKCRKLIHPNVTTNDLDIDFIKKALLETENDNQFAFILEEKKYEFTIVHKMEPRHEDEDLYDIMKEYGSLPVPNGTQCPLLQNKLLQWRQEEN